MRVIDFVIRRRLMIDVFQDRPPEVWNPIPALGRRHRSDDLIDTIVVRPPRLERGTPGLEGRCSIQLSYGRLSS